MNMIVLNENQASVAARLSDPIVVHDHEGRPIGRLVCGEGGDPAHLQSDWIERWEEWHLGFATD